jgi:hypothetical protein
MDDFIDVMFKETVSHSKSIKESAAYLEIFSYSVNPLSSVLISINIYSYSLVGPEPK